MRKQKARKSTKRSMIQISGLRINYQDTNPLLEGEDQSTIKGLPYGHKNSLFKKNAVNIFADNREFLFKSELNWIVTVTPISITGEPMRDAVECSARCRCDDITDSVLGYIEETMAELDMDFYDHWLFCCEVGL